MKVMGEVKSSSSDSGPWSAPRERKSKATSVWILATARSSSTRTYSSGAAHVEGRQAEHDGRHAVLAIPARIGAADAHVHGRRARPAPRPRPRRCAATISWPGSVKEGSKRRMARQRHALERRQPFVELGRQHVGGDADRQPDVGAGDGVRRHQVGRGAAFDGADVDGDALQRLGFAGARQRLGDRLGRGDRLGDDGRRLEGQAPRDPSAGRARCAAGRWRWCRDGRARRAPASRSPRPRPTSGPSRRSARPWASRRRRRYWRRPARAARAPSCSRCRASPCSPRRRQASARSRPPRRRDARRAAPRPAASRPCRPSCRRRRGHRACRPSARRPAAARSRAGPRRSGKVSRWPLKISRRPGRRP